MALVQIDFQSFSKWHNSPKSKQLGVTVTQLFTGCMRLQSNPSRKYHVTQTRKPYTNLLVNFHGHSNNNFIC